MVNTKKIYFLVLLCTSSLVLGAETIIKEDIHLQTNYDFIGTGVVPLSCTDKTQKELFSSHKKIIFCKKNNLCVKTNKKDICFNTKTDENKNYSFLGKIPNKNIVIIRFEGEEEFSDYFISLRSGKKLLELPSIFDGFLQTKISPKRDFMLVITTNNGYSGNPYLTNIDLYKLIDEEKNKFVKEISFTFKEKTEGPHTYKIEWLTDNEVRIQDIENNDYIILSLINTKWEVKDKNYKTWTDYDPLEGL